MAGGQVKELQWGIEEELNRYFLIPVVGIQGCINSTLLRLVYFFSQDPIGSNDT